MCASQAIKSDLAELVKKFLPESIGKEIEKQCQGVYPLQNVFIRKVKVLKTPKFDLTKLMDLHGEGADDAGAAVDRAEPSAVEALPGSGGRL
jgi:small subunit ribosomal protein S3Ae